MRVSVRKNDPGYKAFLENKGRILVFLDGQPITGRCITADEEEGLVLCNALLDGKPYLNEEKTEVVTELLEGKVEVRII